MTSEPQTNQPLSEAMREINRKIALDCEAIECKKHPGEHATSRPLPDGEFLIETECRVLMEEIAQRMPAIEAVYENKGDRLI